MTHCMPSGALGVGELPVPPATRKNIAAFPSWEDHVGNGPYRGIIVYLHGGLGYYPTDEPSFPTEDITEGFVNYGFSYWTSIAADGWITIQPNYTESRYPVPSTALAGDWSNDPAGDSSRYKNNWLAHWDHIVEFIHANFGNDWPIVVHGGSWGGLHAAHILENRSDDVIAGILQLPATIVSNIPTALSDPEDFGSIDTTGLDVGPNALDEIPADLPVLVHYGTEDTFVGWGMPGQGTYTEPPDLPDSNTDLIIINALAAGKDVTRYETDNSHLTFSTAERDTFLDFFTDSIDPLAPLDFNL